MKNNPLPIMSAVGALLIFLECWFLFHYNHKYKALSKDMIVFVYADEEFEVGDRITYASDGISGSTNLYKVQSADTATITKILR